MTDGFSAGLMQLARFLLAVPRTVRCGVAERGRRAPPRPM